MTAKQRSECEFLILSFFDKLDTTGENSDYYKEHFARMSDAEFLKWMKKEYPIQMQHRAFETEPKFKNYKAAANVININLMEKVALPYQYKDENGNPLISKPALIMYLHHKKMQQCITTKNKVSTDIGNIDAKTGRLNNDSKGAATSDKEFECLTIMGLNKTAQELSTIRADYLDAKSQAYSSIMSTGTCSEEDYDLDRADSLANNLISSYLIAAHIDNNLINKEGYTPYTLKEKQRKTLRED